MLGSAQASFKLFAPAAVLVAAVLCLLPAGASAAVQFGSECTANSTNPSPNRFMVQVGRSSGQAVATSAPGVVTKWAVHTAGQGGIEEKLKVLRPLSSSSFEAIGESGLESIVTSGTSEFTTRIPVPAGAIFGAAVTSGHVPYCTMVPGLTEADKTKNRSEDIPLNGSGTQDSESFIVAIALRVTVEPDADGDGYGDETQDQCPTDKAVQGPCPTNAPVPGGGGSGVNNPPTPATLKISSAKLEGNTVAVKLGASAQASVTVTGSIRGKPAAPAATATIQPGAIGRAYLTLSKPTLQRLAKLPHKQHLTLVIEAQSTGSVPVSRELALLGRKKPRHQHHS